MKRRRLSNDVDGDVDSDEPPSAKKKRRLRLVLITSRLSPPFSIPATYIVSRGTSKIAVWARQRALGLGRCSLRKAAILNRVQRRALQLRNSYQPWLQPFFRRFLPHINTVVLPSSLSQPSSPNAVAPHLIFPAGSAATVGNENQNLLVSSGSSSQNSEQRGFDTSPWQTPAATHDAGPGGDSSSGPLSPPGPPRRQYIPLQPRSPLSLTNYDYSVFDNEDGGSDGDDDDHGHELIYSDFNNILLEPSEPVLDDHDSLAAFDSLLFWKWTREGEDRRRNEEDQ
ncbi:hypothetical protein VTN96DRAFT_4593 [Rasamsonia emersonii]